MKSARQKPIKFSRTSTEKAKTGCSVCKKRHVKCDEGKPSCGNCLRRKESCDGYASKPRKKKLPGLLCWDSKERAAVNVVETTPPRIQLLVDPDSLDPHDHRSGMPYFLEFVSLAQGPCMTAISNDNLWAAIIPQIATNNETLRSAATAIGALSIWHRQRGGGPRRKVSAPSGPNAAEDVHYFQAIAYYGRALKINHDQTSSQRAVLLSVLLLLFEMLRGNRKVALDHVNHGLALLLTVLADGESYQFLENLAPDPKTLLGAIADVFIYLTTFTRVIFRDRLDQGPALPNLIKGLKTRKQTVASFVSRLTQLHGSPMVIDHEPAVYESLYQFEQRWTTIRRRQTTLTVILLEAMQASDFPKEFRERSFNYFYTELCHNPQIQEFCRQSTQVVQELYTAFTPLFDTLIMSDIGSEPYLKAIHLRLQLLAVQLFENPPLMLDVESVRAQTPKYHEFLSLAGAAVQAARRGTTNPAHRISLQCPLVWNLFVVTLFCRDPLTRDQAAGMLRDYPGQDGLWNAWSLFVLAQRNREVERTNMLDGTPAEQWQRLLRREVIFEDGGDRVVFRCLDRDTASGEWELVEEVADTESEAELPRWERRPLTGKGGILMLELYET
ncbi:hypothetical protein BJ166DRAFT_529547 [Pestalotiopsis sp. NC0098]|nr:hypothetical protein BJ166DRAFT_529547 [Pestalotiopsis sp. NC0098]